jgi:hypothetical protein
VLSDKHFDLQTGRRGSRAVITYCSKNSGTPSCTSAKWISGSILDDRANCDIRAKKHNNNGLVSPKNVPPLRIFGPLSPLPIEFFIGLNHLHRNSTRSGRSVPAIWVEFCFFLSSIDPVSNLQAKLQSCLISRRISQCNGAPQYQIRHSGTSNSMKG